MPGPTPPGRIPNPPARGPHGLLSEVERERLALLYSQAYSASVTAQRLTSEAQEAQREADSKLRRYLDELEILGGQATIDDFLEDA